MERSSLYPTDYNWRVLESEGGKLRAVADIGTHWLDLVQTITGLKVAAVCADLRTVFPTRQRPQGEVETFSGKVNQQQATIPVEITTEDMGGVMVPLPRNTEKIHGIGGKQHAVTWSEAIRSELCSLGL